ncbi:MAG: NAD-dependent epimerase/dehydratase family protein [Ilumatobacter sp.]
MVTGSTGYIGGRIAAHLDATGWDVTPWSRDPGPTGVPFQLGQHVSAAAFDGASALVHCAYDLGAHQWADIERVNVDGSIELLNAAKRAGMERIVVISSVSAFDGCRSLYGRAKLEIEGAAFSVGATVIRPGLVWGDRPGGVLGGLVNQVCSSRVIPAIDGGRHIQYLAHDADLAELVRIALEGSVGSSDAVFAGHPQPWSLRQILVTIAQQAGRRPIFLHVPWQLAWLGLRTFERIGVRTPFRSDSVVSIVHQNPELPAVHGTDFGVQFRAFAPTPSMLTRR